MRWLTILGPLVLILIAMAIWLQQGGNDDAAAAVMCPSGTNTECFETNCAGEGGSAQPSEPCWCTHCRDNNPIQANEYFCAPLAEHQGHEPC